MVIFEDTPTSFTGFAGSRSPAGIIDITQAQIESVQAWVNDKDGHHDQGG